MLFKSRNAGRSRAHQQALAVREAPEALEIRLIGFSPYTGEEQRLQSRRRTGLFDEIEWGGHWTSFVDRPHYQLATGRVRRRFEAGEPYT